MSTLAAGGARTSGAGGAPCLSGRARREPAVVRELAVLASRTDRASPTWHAGQLRRSEPAATKPESER
jgi:hypothetical protein